MQLSGGEILEARISHNLNIILDVTGYFDYNDTSVTLTPDEARQLIHMLNQVIGQIIEDDESEA